VVESLDPVLRAARDGLKRTVHGVAEKFIAPLHSRLIGYQARQDIYDITFWNSLSSLDPVTAIDFLKVFAESPKTEMDIELPPAQYVQSKVESCRGQYGVWPISLSFPEKAARTTEKTQVISRVIPGEAYAFESQVAYYLQYAQSNYAITHRKAGWDCFRHVEILAAGCIPLMIDAADIPQCSMVHYPKEAFIEIVSRVEASGALPSEQLITAFANWFDRHLTAEAMANYTIQAASLADVQRVLFVDQRLPLQPDYQSLLALIGLKQVLGDRCEVLHPVDYVYQDWRGDATKNYGRGFGYTRVLDPKLRTRHEVGRETSSRVRRQLKEESFDLVVVGSLARNGPLAHKLLTLHPPNQTIWIHGEDHPPSPREMHFIRASGTHAFVRAIPENY